MTTDDTKYTFGEPPDYAPFPEDDQREFFPLATQELPDKVVATEFALVVVSRTAIEDPRTGGLQVSLKFGDRENPTDLTEQEATYVREVLLAVARELSTTRVP